MIRLATTLAVAVIAVAGCAGDAETATPATSEAPPAAVQASPTEITIAAAPEPSEAQKKAFFTALASIDPALATNQEQALTIGSQVCEKILSSPEDPMQFSTFAAEQLSVAAPTAEGFVAAVAEWCSPE
ncbi:hypothetical protein [Herbidospora mongoliensis]|uniref:hypothetical protein n=1 Tax=Herbidospora mongoliensis TaxID=688067 RepID=UPI00082AE816|nr:hypothetical protein [Herbidospora mongoliensis]